MTETIAVQELGRTITFSFRRHDALPRARFTGRCGRRVQGYAARVRRAVAGRATAAPVGCGPHGVPRPGWPGDGFEAVTRAVTDGRFTVDRSLVRSDRGRLLEDFVFEIGIGPRSVTLLLRDGFVTEEFIDLARCEQRSPGQESRLDELKADLARRVMAAAAADVYDIESHAG